MRRKYLDTEIVSSKCSKIFKQKQSTFMPNRMGDDQRKLLQKGANARKLGERSLRMQAAGEKFYFIALMHLSYFEGLDISCCSQPTPFKSTNARRKNCFLDRA